MHVAHRLKSKHLLLDKDYVDLIDEIDEQLAQVPDLDSYMADDFWSFDDFSILSMLRPYNVSNGILTIPVKGLLLSSFPFAFGSYATGYRYIEQALMRGMDDPEVQKIAFLIDSPGGEVTENFDLVEMMQTYRTVKPMVGLVYNNAYSAAYNIAAATDKIITSQSGGVGSIGVVMTHVDMSEALENSGIRVTHIYAGDHKVDGTPYRPLSAEAIDRFQQSVDKLYTQFTTMVAKNRNIPVDSVVATQALTYDGIEGREVLLVDEVMPFTQAQDRIQPSSRIEDTFMTETEPQASMSDVWQTGYDAGLLAGRAEVSVATAAERDRIAGILLSDAAKARPNAARSLALKTAMDAETALSLLGDLPEEGKTGFYRAMDESDNPDVGVEAESPASNDVIAAAKSIGLSGLRNRETR